MSGKETRPMSKSELEARIRQLLAIDKNAADIYQDLADLVPDVKMKADLRKIASEERGHVAISKKILSLLGK
jgi:rubrerythrin